MERTIGRMFISWTPICLMPGIPDRWTVSARFTWPETKRHGTESSHAPARPVMALVAPGPVVKYPAPKRPVSLAYASTAIETACSWCRQMGARPFAQARPSVRCMIPPPESMKTCRTPMSRMKAAR